MNKYQGEIENNIEKERRDRQEEWEGEGEMDGEIKRGNVIKGKRMK